MVERRPSTPARETLASTTDLTPEQILELIDTIDLDKLDRETRMDLCRLGRRAWSAVNGHDRTGGR